MGRLNYLQVFKKKHFVGCSCSLRANKKRKFIEKNGTSEKMAAYRICAPVSCFQQKGWSKNFIQ